MHILDDKKEFKIDMFNGTSCPIQNKENADTKTIINKSEKNIIEISVEALTPLKRNFFKNYEGELLDRLVQSIKQYGILTPLLVRQIPLSGFYEILSGNNRFHAAQILGITKLPCINFGENVSDDEADYIALDTNFCQRSLTEMPHSERAACITKWYELQKKQGVRTDLLNDVLEAEKCLDLGQYETSLQVDTKLNRSDEILGQRFDLSGATIQRYLRIDMLINDLKQRLDENMISFVAAVNLSFLSVNQQDFVEKVLLENQNLNVSIADSLKLKSSKNNLKTKEDVLAILNGDIKPKVEKVRPLKVTLKPKFLKQYLPPEIKSQDQAFDFITQAIKFYLENSKGEQN